MTARISEQDRVGNERFEPLFAAEVFFIACFSKEYHGRDTTYMNEELTLAIEEIRIRHADKTWFIPVKLNECDIPDREIGGGENLHDFTYIALYENWDQGIERIVKEIQQGSPQLNQDTDQRAQEEFYKGSGFQNRADEATDPEEKRRGYEKAIRCYTEAVGLRIDFAEAYYNRAIAHDAVGSIPKAIEDFTSAITLQYKFPDAHYNRGLAYFKRKDYDEAIEDITKSIELRPTFPDAYYVRARVWLRLNEWEKAKEDLETFRSMQS